MGNSKLLTIIIPTYNRCKWIYNSLSYLLPQCQHFSDEIQLLVIDNCSTDDTCNTVNRFLNKGYNFEYVINEKNLGISGSLRKSLKLANSKFIWILGDDDFLMEGKLPYLIEVIKNNQHVPFFYLNMQVWHPTRDYEENESMVDEINSIKKDTVFAWQKHNKTNRIATFSRGYFNAISNLILTKEHTVAAYQLAFDKIDEGVSEYASIETTFPHCCYIAEKLMDVECVEIISPIMICAGDLTWNKYYEIVWFQWFPQVFVKMRSNGASKMDINNALKYLLSEKYPAMISKLIKGKIELYGCFSWTDFIKRNIYYKEFWMLLFRVLLKRIN